MKEPSAGWVVIGIVVLIARAISAARATEKPWVLTSVLAAIVVVAACAVVLVVRDHRLTKAYREAFERGDADALARIRAILDRHLPAPMRNVGLGEELLVRERYAEARDALARVARSELPLGSRPGILSNLAYATALAGDHARGVDLARQALEEASAQAGRYPDDKRASIQGTLGIALSLAARHEDAAATLAPLLDAPGTPRAKATHAHFLGASLRALGRVDEAMNAYAFSAARVSPWATRSRAAIASMTPHRG